MSLLKRIKTLWILSGINLLGADTQDEVVKHLISETKVQEAPVMAKVIKRKSPSREFIENNPNE